MFLNWSNPQLPPSTGIAYTSVSFKDLVLSVPANLFFIFSIFTFIHFSNYRELRSRVPQKIVINFSLSLLFLLLTFLFGVDDSFTKLVNAPEKTPVTCHIVASFIHAFILSTFFWMAVQAIFLYKKAVRATKNRGESRKLYQICFWSSWGKILAFSTSSGIKS